MTDRNSEERLDTATIANAESPQEGRGAVEIARQQDEAADRMMARDGDAKVDRERAEAGVAERTADRPEPAADGPATADDEQPAPLFGDVDTSRYRERWREIQVGFVDDPRSAVDDADELVAAVMKDLAQTFSEQRGGLIRGWEAEGEVSTEDLRLTLRRYRSFFHRLLSL